MKIDNDIETVFAGVYGKMYKGNYWFVYGLKKLICWGFFMRKKQKQKCWFGKSVVLKLALHRLLNIFKMSNDRSPLFILDVTPLDK